MKIGELIFMSTDLSLVGTECMPIPSERRSCVDPTERLRFKPIGMWSSNIGLHPVPKTPS